MSDDTLTLYCHNHQIHQIATIYLQVVADFQWEFGEGNGHSSALHLAEPGVYLLPGQEFLQAFKGLQVVGHDKDHRGLLLAQRHVQHKDTVLCVIVEVIQTCKGQTNLILLAFFFWQNQFWRLHKIKPEVDDMSRWRRNSPVRCIMGTPMVNERVTRKPRVSTILSWNFSSQWAGGQNILDSVTHLHNLLTFPHVSIVITNQNIQRLWIKEI